MKRVALVVALALALIPATAANAEYKNTGKSFTQSEGGFLGTGATIYTYKIFKDNASWYWMRKDASPTFEHKKGSGKTVLTYSKTASVTKTVAVDFSAAMGVGVSGKLVEATLSRGIGVTFTNAYSVATSGAASKEIPSSSKTGRYKLSIMNDFDKIQYKKYNTNTGQYISTHYANLPKKRDTYISLLYSATGSNFSKA